MEKGELGVEDFSTKSLKQTGEYLGWLAGYSYAGTPIAGVHIHILDHFGHLYAERPEKLKKKYIQVDEMIGEFSELLENTVVISDHGMQTSEISTDENPGVHSQRALVSSDFTGSLPPSIFDVRTWLEPEISDEGSEQTEHEKIDTPREHLEDLGYL